MGGEARQVDQGARRSIWTMDHDQREPSAAGWTRPGAATEGPRAGPAAPSPPMWAQARAAFVNL